MSESLKQKAVKGLVWNFTNTFGNKVLGFGISVILARLLTPTDFGVLAMIGVFTSIIVMFTDGGLTTALVRKENRTEADMATVFWYNLVTCYIVYAVLFVTAPLIADFYGMPMMTNIIRVSSIGLLIGPFSGIQSMLLTTRIDFKTPALISAVCVIVSGSVAVVMAYSGYGVWALVVQGVISTVISVGLNIWAVRWYPKAGFSKKSFRELFGFSSKLLASQVLATGYNNITPLIVGKFYSPAQLGEYGRALNWASLPSTTFTGVLQSVTFPVLSKMQDDDIRLAVNYRKLLRMSAFVTFPLMVGLSAIARPLTLFLLTEKWENSIILLQIICFSLMWFPIHAINLNLLTVKGRSDLFFRLEVIKKVCGLIILVSTLPFGLVVFCLGSVFSSMLFLVVNTYYTGKLIHVGYFRQMKDITPILLNSLVMCGICILVQQPIATLLNKLIVAIVVGVVYYITSSYIFRFSELRELVALVKK